MTKIDISGSSVNDAREYILRMLSENNNNVQRRDRGPPEEQKSKKIEIEPNCVGMVIGRGGGTIRDIESNYSVNLRIGNFFSNKLGLWSFWTKGKLYFS